MLARARRSSDDVKRARLAVVVVAAASLAWACHAGDEDYAPPIAVQPGAVARAMQLVARYKGGDAVDAGAGADDEEEEEEAPGRIAFACVDAHGDGGTWLARAPCAADVEGVDGSASPEFAEDTLLLASGALVPRRSRPARIA